MGQSHNEKPGAGFSGLESMVSDVSRDVEAAARAPSQQKTEAKAKATESQRSEASAQTTPESPQSGSAEPRSTPASELSGGKWLLGIVGTVVVLWLIATSGKQDTPQYMAPPASEPTPLPIPAPSGPPPLAVPPPAPKQPLALVVPPTTSGTAQGQKPPVGSGLVLEREQIRYCLSEKIRLDAIETVLNDTRRGEVDKFNVLVEDYNSRCGNFRYRRGLLESVRSEVEAQRSELENAAQTNWLRSALGLRTPPSSQRQPQDKQARSEGASRGAADTRTGKDRSATSNDLNSEEVASIEAACYLEKQVSGPAAYKQCVSNKIAALKRGPRNIDLSGLSREERSSLEAACYLDKQTEGPAAYNQCLSNKLSALKGAPRNIDLSGLSRDERASIESACYLDKQTEGPAAYNRCVASKLNELRKAPRNIDLSALSYDQRASIESACYLDKQTEGPAAYNRCVRDHLAKLRR